MRSLLVAALKVRVSLLLLPEVVGVGFFGGVVVGLATLGPTSARANMHAIAMDMLVNLPVLLAWGRLGLRIGTDFPFLLGFSGILRLINATYNV